MTYQPFIKKYDLDAAARTDQFPEYFREQLSGWIWNQFAEPTAEKSELSDDFLGQLQIIFRQMLPSNKWYAFLEFLFSSSDNVCHLLDYCLQHTATDDQAHELQRLLNVGGSAFTIAPREQTAGEKEATVGHFRLAWRNPRIINQAAHAAIDHNELLCQAWNLCYGLQPDYAQTVIKCTDFLEHFLRDRYQPDNAKPQLGQLIGDLRAQNGAQLSFKGDDILAAMPNHGGKALLLRLIDQFPKYRGLHTAGDGVAPTKQDAEFVLHTTIYLWDLHQTN